MTLGRRFPNSSKMIMPMMSISIGPGMPKKTAKGRDTAETSEIETAGAARDDTPLVSVGVNFHYIAATGSVKLPGSFLTTLQLSEARPFAGEAGLGTRDAPGGRLGRRDGDRHGSRSKACSQ